MTANRLSQKGIAAASLAVILLVVLSIMINTSMFFRCKFGADCNPFGGESMEEQTVNADANAKAIGAATQFMLGLDTSGYTMINATKKYAYCREGPGNLGELRCTDTPTESDITDTADGFRPFTDGLIDAISAELPFLSGFSHSFTLSRGDETLLTAGNDGGEQQLSRFIFAAPIAGGENIELELALSKGQTASGVFER
jgi:hypothetical protein